VGIAGRDGIARGGRGRVGDRRARVVGAAVGGVAVARPRGVLGRAAEAGGARRGIVRATSELQQGQGQGNDGEELTRPHRSYLQYASGAAGTSPIVGVDPINWSSLRGRPCSIDRGVERGTARAK